jgi:hypothetical protein
MAATREEQLVKLRSRASTSKAAAIKLFCIECVGDERDDIRNCTATGCALYAHRPYQTKAAA